MGNITDSTVLKTEGVGDTHDQMPSFPWQSRKGGNNTDDLPLKCHSVNGASFITINY